MHARMEQQQRLRRIAQAIDSDADVSYGFDYGVFKVIAPNRRDVPLAENFVADRSDGQIRDEIMLRWGLKG